MRCLTLADTLAVKGAECHFICREHAGHLLEHIQRHGHQIHVLPLASDAYLSSRAEPSRLTHADWLGTTQQRDAQLCIVVLEELQPDWLIVDHYALDANWESRLRMHTRHLMVIDDLADREHDCDILLDQTFGRDADDYLTLVPDHCLRLCGSQYALLRPEFVALRPYSLQRRAHPKLEHVLITMGGVDKDNTTGRVLEALRNCTLPEQCRITVVMGATAPWLANVRLLAADMPWRTTVKVNVNDMAQLMANSDLAIGAAGATSWERCCLGLPTIMLVLAENQQQIAINLEQSKAVYVIAENQGIDVTLPSLLEPQAISSAQLILMSQAAAGILDGQGITAIIQHLEF